MHKIKKSILIFFGLVSLSFGIIGIFVPLLPTTPFLLLSAACFAKSSNNLYIWMYKNKYFGKYLTNYREGKGIRLKHKISALILLWLSIGYSALFIVNSIWIKLLLFIIALSVTIHIIKVRTFQVKFDSNQ
jgi:uncharacterized protein